MVPVSPAPAFIAIQLKKIISAFQQRELFYPEKAVSPEELGLRQNLMFRRLVGRGVLKEASPGRFYLDREKLEEFNALRRKKIFIVMGIILIAILIYAILYKNN
jgi:hypothetical protein